MQQRLFLGHSDTVYKGLWQLFGIFPPSGKDTGLQRGFFTQKAHSHNAKIMHISNLHQTSFKIIYIGHVHIRNAH